MRQKQEDLLGGQLPAVVAQVRDHGGLDQGGDRDLVSIWEMELMGAEGFEWGGGSDGGVWAETVRERAIVRTVH